MGVKENARNIAIKEGIKFLKKDFDKNAPVLIDRGIKLVNDPLKVKALEGLKAGLQRPDNMWAGYAKKIVEYTDESVMLKLVEPLYNMFVAAYDKRIAAFKKYDCNIPWAILIDLTTACNLKCTGCWASEYGKAKFISNEVLQKIVDEGREIGTYLYLFTGGEPLVRKKDLIQICENNPDCLFISFTNGTLCDDEFADEVKRVGNLWLTMSIEGNEETTDARRGKGTYKAVTAAMARLKERGVPFGASLCCTKYNSDVIASDEYADFLIDLGILFAWYFTFVPVGADSTPELMSTAEQRKFLYDQVRKWRFEKGKQKPLFTIDFFNDGEYVGGCIAGGKQYFHINPNGDCEPCVFCHYSSVNINDSHIIDALQSPIFMAYRKRQPFSDNMLRPCPIMDNPGAIKKMVRETGAASTDISSPEAVEDLAAKTVNAAKEWKVVADELAEEHGFIKNRLRSIDFYRDLEENRLKDFDEFG
ncbi:MAG: radical SAM protein [Clostridiales bacterium]|nr:radical SAM protein [Clostridiales bacterium]